MVRICSSMMVDAYFRPAMKIGTWVGKFLLFFFPVIAATIVVWLNWLPTSFWIISTGRIFPCSLPSTGLSLAKYISPLRTSWNTFSVCITSFSFHQNKTTAAPAWHNAEKGHSHVIRAAAANQSFWILTDTYPRYPSVSGNIPDGHGLDLHRTCTSLWFSRAALIALDCDWTEVSLSSLPVIAIAAVPCGVRSDHLARPRKQTTERTYPVCWYSIVKEQDGDYLTHPLVSSLKGKISTLFLKIFFIFWYFFCL